MIKKNSMNLHNPSKSSNKKAPSNNLKALKNLKKSPALKLMTKDEIENNRISAYAFVI
jgi:hypothetical protein